MMSLTPWDTDAISNSIIWLEVTFTIYFLLSWPTISIMWCRCWHLMAMAPMALLNTNVMLHLIMASWPNEYNDVVPLTMPSASNDTNAGGSGITWPKSHIAPCSDHFYLISVVVLLTMPLSSCDVDAITSVVTLQKSQVAYKFDCLDLMNALIVYMKMLASHDANKSANGITWQKSYVVLHFNCPDLTNGMVPLTMPSASCDDDTSANGIMWTKKSCCMSFQWSGPNECHGGIVDAIGVTWHWNWHQ